MNILYFSMGESTHEDAYEALCALGHQVRVMQDKLKDYSVDDSFEAKLQELLEKETYDIVFAFFFIPLIARITHLKKVRYVVWLYDGGIPLTLQSELVFSPYNYIFTFDKADCVKLKEKGIRNVWHLPLAVNINRLKKLLVTSGETGFDHEVSFVGSLYDNTGDYFSKCLPEYTKGYIDAITLSQVQIPGAELIEELLTDELMRELKKWINVVQKGEYTYTERDVYIRLLLKRVTGQERKILLERISEVFAMALYTNSDSSFLSKVKNYGYADYKKKMPLVFAHSKINLNFTYRVIRSGVPLRALDIMGAGGFLLSNYQPELFELFEVGRDFAIYESPADLLEKIAYYLTHDEERMEIALRGQQKIEKGFTYEIQFGKLFRTLECDHDTSIV